MRGEAHRAHQDEVAKGVAEGTPRQDIDDIEAFRIVGLQQEAGWGGEPVDAVLQ